MKSNLDDQQEQRPIASIMRLWRVCSLKRQVLEGSSESWAEMRAWKMLHKLVRDLVIAKAVEKSRLNQTCAKCARHYEEFSQQCLVTWRKSVRRGRWVDGFCVSWAKSTNVHTCNSADIQSSDLLTIRFMEELLLSIENGSGTTIGAGHSKVLAPATHLKNGQTKNWFFMVSKVTHLQWICSLMNAQ